MDSRYYPSGRTRTRGSAAALIALLLSLLLAPAALAEPLEGEPSGTTTTKIEPAPGWEHNKSYLEYLDRQHAAYLQPTPGWETNKSYLEYLDRQRATAQASDSSAYRAQQEAYLRYLEQKAAAASGGEPAVATSADDSGQPWLVGAGVAIAVAIASIVLAIIRTRPQETVTPVQRERDQVNT